MNGLLKEINTPNGEVFLDLRLTVISVRFCGLTLMSSLRRFSASSLRRRQKNDKAIMA